MTAVMAHVTARRCVAAVSVLALLVGGNAPVARAGVNAGGYAPVFRAGINMSAIRDTIYRNGVP